MRPQRINLAEISHSANGRRALLTVGGRSSGNATGVTIPELIHLISVFKQKTASAVPKRFY